MSTVRLGSMALQGVNKAGTLKPDDKGWYKVILGALEFPNSYGAIYKAQPARDILDGDSPFTRRLKKGQLIGECGHPRREPGMSEQDYVNRLMDVHEDKESHTIKEIVIDTTCKDKQGRPFIGFVGLVKPSGPFGPSLERKFSDPDMNVCFSIRSFTRDKYEQGRLVKYLTSVVTFDNVGEPGISVAEKYNAPGLESYGEVVVTENIINNIIENNTKMGLESAESTAQARFIKNQLESDYIDDIKLNKPVFSGSW